MPIWYKKAEELAKEASIRNNILWIKKNGKLVIFVPYSLRHELMTSAHGEYRNAKRGSLNAISGQTWTTT